MWITRFRDYTAYTVSSGGCCDGVATAIGFRYTYMPDAGGDVWTLHTTTQVTGTTAQGDCCDDA